MIHMAKEGDKEERGIHAGLATSGKDAALDLSGMEPRRGLGTREQVFAGFLPLREQGGGCWDDLGGRQWQGRDTEGTEMSGS